MADVRPGTGGGAVNGVSSVDNYVGMPVISMKCRRDVTADKGVRDGV